MRQRVLQGTPAALQVTLYDQDGQETAAAGALTATVTGGDGTVLLTGATASPVVGSVGEYTVSLPASATALLNLLTAVWTDTARSVTTQHEVVGGYLFSLKEARASNDGDLADEGRFPDAAVLDARRLVEDEAEWICDVAFVPRYQRDVLGGDGTNTLVLGRNRIRTVRSVWTYPIVGGIQYVAFTPVQLAGLAFGEDGTIRRTDAAVFDDGTNNIAVEYEHGHGSPPELVKEAGLLRLRSVLTRSVTGIDARATSYTGENGQTYRLATASTFRTGIPEVDAAYGKYSYRSQDTGSGQQTQVPASRQLNMDPQRYSVFHGGVR